MKKTLSLVKDFRKKITPRPSFSWGTTIRSTSTASSNSLPMPRRRELTASSWLTCRPRRMTSVPPPWSSGLDSIRLTTPTTDDARAPAVFGRRGFVYYVSVLGITGTKAPDLKNVKANVKRLKKHQKLPILRRLRREDGGAGTHAIAETADGVVVGSALVSAVANSLTPKGKATPQGQGRKPCTSW